MMKSFLHCAPTTSVVYLAGPINGCSDAECKDWREYVKSKLPRTIDPMRRDYRGKEALAFKEIVEGDKRDIDASTTLLVNYDKPSTGTSMEILYAWERGKNIVLVCSATTMLSPWLLYHCHKIVHTFDAAIAGL